MYRLFVTTLVLAGALSGCRGGSRASGRPSAPATGATLAVPSTVQGTLSASDTRLQDGSVADDYVLNLTANQPVTIVVRGGPSTSEPGSNLDVYAIILRNGAEIAHDDDSAGNLNARLVFTPPTTGQYTLRVTTFGSGLHQGAYTVQTWPGANPNAT